MSQLKICDFGRPLYLLKVYLQKFLSIPITPKCQILICDTLVANERYVLTFLDIFFVIKPTRCTNFTYLFRHKTLHVLDSSSVHHQKFIHCTLSNVICHTSLYTAFGQDQDGSWPCPKAVYKPV